MGVESWIWAFMPEESAAALRWGQFLKTVLQTEVEEFTRLLSAT
jgi:hypothetical protein